MKKKDLQNLREKKIDDLMKTVSSKKIELTKAQVMIKASNEKNLKKPKNLRHEISQILTLIKEKKLLEKFNSKEGENIKKE